MFKPRKTTISSTLLIRYMYQRSGTIGNWSLLIVLACRTLEIKLTVHLNQKNHKSLYLKSQRRTCPSSHPPNIKEDLSNWKQAEVTREVEERMNKGWEGWDIFQIVIKVRISDVSLAPCTTRSVVGWSGENSTRSTGLPVNSSTCNRNDD